MHFRFFALAWITILAITPNYSFAQSARQKKSGKANVISSIKRTKVVKVQPLEDCAEFLSVWCSLSKMEWSLAFGPDKADSSYYVPRRGSDAYEWAERFGVQNNPPSMDAILVRKNLSLFKDCFSGLSLIGGEKAYFTGDEKFPPCHFLKKGNSKVFLVANIAIPTWLNGAETNDKDRASIITKKYALDALKTVYVASKSVNSVDYFSVMITYGVKTGFAEEIEQKTAEAVVMLVHRRYLDQFQNSEITDDDLVAHSDVYIHTNYMIPSNNLQKVQVDF